MNNLKYWVIGSWMALPTVMYGGYSLLNLINKGDALTPFQLTWFRAGHGHAGLLLLLSLLFFVSLEKTSLSPPVKNLVCAVLIVGVVAQSAGFFIHMLVGQPDQASIGTLVTTSGAVALVLAIAVLVFGLIKAPRHP